jgi:nucleotide-binding universal stress UspA family protein
MPRFNRILYVVDFDQPDAATLERAVRLAETNRARLTAAVSAPGNRVYTGMPEGIGMTRLREALLDGRRQLLESLLDSYRGRIEVEFRILQGSLFLEIIREILRGGHDLVVKNPERYDFLDHLLGSDDMHLLRKCPCPVWLVKAGTPGKYRRVLAAVDVDDNYPARELEIRHGLNREILELADAVATADAAELHVAHAWDAPAEKFMRGSALHISDAEIAAYVDQVHERRVRNLKRLVRQTGGVPPDGAPDRPEPELHLPKGWARREIPLLAKQIGADLIVMGTVARTGIPGFIMGNTAETILGKIDCSVLAIKPAGFETPVTLVE